MARTESTMLPLGTSAPHFSLTDTVSGRTVSLTDLNRSPALVVAFICNHCPFVKHIRDGWTELANHYHAKGIAVIAISSNDAETYPADGPELMKAEAESAGYKFPYLFDETQIVALAYRAACTPDFYVFDAERKLVYRGQMDASRPDNGIPVDGGDLRAAVEAVLAGQPVNAEQKPSVGCNIKWKAANAPQ